MAEAVYEYDVDEDEEESIPLDLKLDLNVIQRAGLNEIRGATDIYYALQKERIMAQGRARAADASGEPSGLMSGVCLRLKAQEAWVRGVLHKWAKAQDMGRWALQVVGIGPVLAAGFAAHIDVRRLGTVSALWRYAGQDPSVIWPSSADALAWVKERGVKLATDDDYLAACQHFGRHLPTLKRLTETDGKGKSRKPTADALAKAIARLPWNKTLKVLCWKAGQSFLKCSGRPKSLYGRLYRERKALELSRNSSGALAGQAAKALGAKKYRGETIAKAAYEAGTLPPAHLDARARRYVVKMFLSHYWEAARRKLDLPYANPWVLAHGGHVDRVEPEVPWDA